MRTPAGYVSVNAAPVIAVALALVSVIVRTDVPPTPIADGANALAMVRGDRNAEDVEVAELARAGQVVVDLAEAERQRLGGGLERQLRRLRPRPERGDLIDRRRPLDPDARHARARGHVQRLQHEWRDAS